MELGCSPWVATSRTRLSDFTFTFHFHALEEEMATHSRILAWKIPWMEEPGGLQSMGHSESDTTERLHFHVSLSCIGEGNGNPLQCSCLVGCHLWGLTESDTTEVTQQQQQFLLQGCLSVSFLLIRSFIDCHSLSQNNHDKQVHLSPSGCKAYCSMLCRHNLPG